MPEQGSLLWDQLLILVVFGFFLLGLGCAVAGGGGGDYATKPIYFRLESGITPIPISISYYM